MQETIDRLAKELGEEVRDRANHPIILTNYEMLGEPTVGIPLAMQLKWVSRLSKDASFINREGWELVPINEDVTAVPNDERKKFESAVWDRMMSEPPLSLTLPYTASTSGNLLKTTPLTEAQVQMLVSGHALVYFMEELRDPTTNQVVLSFCQFVSNPGVVTDCFSHNKT